MGGSKGGTMTEKMMCDPTVAHNFKGFAALSALVSAFGSNDAALPECPYVRAGHHNFSSLWMWGTKDTSYYGNATSYVSGVLASGPRWLFSQPDNARVFIAPLLGCNTRPTVANVQTNVTRTTYTGCANTSVAVEVVVNVGGGHSWSGLSANGFSPQQYAWDFVATHYPRSATPAAPAEVVSRFAMPGRNIGCQMRRPDDPSGTVECLVRSTRTSRLPPLHWRLGVSKRAAVSRSNARIADSGVRVLRYGQAIQRGYFRCRSRAAGLTCVSKSSHHGFFLGDRKRRSF